MATFRIQKLTLSATQFLVSAFATCSAIWELGCQPRSIRSPPLSRGRVTRQQDVSACFHSSRFLHFDLAVRVIRVALWAIGAWPALANGPLGSIRGRLPFLRCGSGLECLFDDRLRLRSDEILSVSGGHWHRCPSRGSCCDPGLMALALIGRMCSIRTASRTELRRALRPS